MNLLRTGRRVMMSGAVVIALMASAAAARADVIAVSPAAFPGGSALITFTGLAFGVDVNGLPFGGVQFSYSLGPGQVVISSGPPTANNVSAPALVSEGNPTGILTLLLPGLQDVFGFGFAVQSFAPLVNATTITLFNGATNVGALSYNGALDPQLAGGFAGIQSTLPFNRVQVTFNSGALFAVDNIRFASVTATPEPATLGPVLTGLVGIGILRRRRRRAPT